MGNLVGRLRSCNLSVLVCLSKKIIQIFFKRGPSETINYVVYLHRNEKLLFLLSLNFFFFRICREEESITRVKKKCWFVLKRRCLA